MLRRVSARSHVLTAFSCLQSTIRTAHHKSTVHDWSHIWSRPLAPKDQEAINFQKNRTVSAVVPGEMFMRHWIAAEQSTYSVADRVVSGMILVVCMVWAAGYATLGYNSHTCAHLAGWMFVAAYFSLLYFQQPMLGLVLALGAAIHLGIQ